MLTFDSGDDFQLDTIDACVSYLLRSLAWVYPVQREKKVALWFPILVILLVAFLKEHGDKEKHTISPDIPSHYQAGESTGTSENYYHIP